MNEAEANGVHREIGPPSVGARGELIFTSREQLERFLAQHPEVENNEHEVYRPVDVGNVRFKDLQQIMLEFEPYADFSLRLDRLTNNLYLGDVNLGGHGAQFRIVKIVRRDIFERPDFLESWYLDYAAKIWSE